MDDGLGHAGRHRNHIVLVLQGHFNLGPSAKEPAEHSGVPRSTGTLSGNQARSKHTGRRAWKETQPEEHLLEPTPLPP